MSPCWYKQKRYKAAPKCSTGGMDYLWEQSNVSPCYIALYQMHMKKSETPVSMLPTSSKIQLLPSCCLKKEGKSHTRMECVPNQDSFGALYSYRHGKTKIDVVSITFDSFSITWYSWGVSASSEQNLNSFLWRLRSWNCQFCHKTFTPMQILYP